MTKRRFLRDSLAVISDPSSNSHTLREILTLLPSQIKKASNILIEDILEQLLRSLALMPRSFSLKMEVENQIAEDHLSMAKIVECVQIAVSRSPSASMV